MLICSRCRTPLEQPETACLNCGADGRMEVDDRGAVVALYKDGSTCTSCGAHADELHFRRYRRVVGLVILDTIHSAAGYLCADCRRKLFWRHMGLTLALGWWGVLALLVRNPWAIAVNIKSLFGPPRNAKKFGASTLEELPS